MLAEWHSPTCRMLGDCSWAHFRPHCGLLQLFGLGQLTLQHTPCSHCACKATPAHATTQCALLGHHVSEARVQQLTEAVLNVAKCGSHPR
jgi:hypothetical protein